MYMRGNFAPVMDELHVERLPVVSGIVPYDLHGVYARNGPNPALLPNEQLLGYHWFDGDGMIHAIRFSRGVASYRNRFVQTDRYLLESKFRRPLGKRLSTLTSGCLNLLRGIWVDRIMKIANLFPSVDDVPAIRDRASTSKYKDLYLGTANTALVHHAGHTLALVESDIPMEIDISSLSTIDRFSFDDRLNHPFSAHPKKDAVTGELFVFGYSFSSSPHLVYSCVDAFGKVRFSLPIYSSRSVMMHDFVITEKYAIFFDFPLLFRPQRCFHGKCGLDFDPSAGARVGVLPRYAKSGDEVVWLSIEPGWVWHFVNGWDEDENLIRIFGCRSREVVFESPIGNRDSLGRLCCSMADDAIAPHLYEWLIDMSSETVSERVCDPLHSVEFPVIHPSLHGRKCRYAYCSLIERHSNEEDITPRLVGCVKYDLFNLERETIFFDRGICGEDASSSAEEEVHEEDDGYIMSFVYHEEKNTSSFQILDAASFSPVPLCILSLPRRVPYGFHGLFVTTEEFSSSM